MLKKIGQIIILTLTAAGGYYLYTAVFAGTTITSNNLNDGLVGYWTFEEGAGTQTGDMSGNGNTGTLVSMSESSWITGKYGGALDFDGSNDKVEVGSDPFELTGAVTLSAWVRLDGSSNGQFLGKQGSATRRNYTLGNDTGLPSNLDFDVSSDCGTNIGVEKTSVLEDATWYHVAGVFRPSESIDLYLDGNLVAQNTTTIPTSMCVNDQQFAIGGRDDTSNPFSGAVDEARVYDRALSHEEVRSLYNLSSNKFHTTQEDKLTFRLVGYWSFDGQYMDLGSSTSEVKDASVQGHHGNWLNHATTTVAGKMGQAIEFDGADDYVACSDADCGGTGGDALDMGLHDWTVSAWVKTSTTTFGNIVTKGGFIGGLNPDTWLVSMGGTGVLGCAIHDSTVGSSNEVCAADGALINDGNWHHTVVAFDRSAGTAKRFVDGQETGTTLDISLYNAVSLDSTKEFRVGARDEASQEGFFDGSIDDVRVYSRLFSDDEIQQLYNLGVGTKINTTQEGKSTTGLVGHWSFDGPYMDWNAASAEVKDSSGQGNDGDATTTMSARSAKRGMVGQALDFDGIGDTITMGDVLDFERTDPFSITVWARPLGDGTLVGKTRGDGSLQGYGIWVGPDYWIFNLRNNTGSNALRVLSNTDVTPSSEYRHFVVTYDGSSDTSGVGMYLDGVSDYGTSDTNNLTSTTVTDFPLAIGSRQGGVPAQYINGDIDEVRIYDYALTEEEILDMYTRESGKKRLDVGLVGYWPFRAGTSTEARDHSEYGNHGTLTNMTDADWVSGQIGYGLDFDGTDDHIQLGTGLDIIQNVPAVTLTAWIKPDLTSTFQMIANISVNSSVNSRASLEVTSTDDIKAGGRAQDIDGYISTETTNSPLVADTWYFVVGVIDYANDRVTVYIDGVQSAQNVAAGFGVASSQNTPSDIGAIGVDEDLTTSDFDGLIDEVRVYNRALSADEVAALYNQDR